MNARRRCHPAGDEAPRLAARPGQKRPGAGAADDPAAEGGKHQRRSRSSSPPARRRQIFPITVRAVLPAVTESEKARADWQLGQLRRHAQALVPGGAGAVEATPTGCGIVVTVGPMELLSFPAGNYRAADDWLLQDGGMANMKQAQAASAAVMVLLGCFACLQSALDEAPQITSRVSAAALAQLEAMLEAMQPEQPEQPEQLELPELQLPEQQRPPQPQLMRPNSPAPSGSLAPSGVLAADCCPIGHKLTKTTVTEPVGCDACEEVLLRGKCCHSCSACEYDICHSCSVAGRAGTTAPLEDSEEELCKGRPKAAGGGPSGDGPDDGSRGGLGQLLHDACAAIEEMASASTPLSPLHLQVHLSESAVLSVSECDAAVHAAEAHAAVNGWATARHVAFPTYDLPIDALGTIGARSITTAVKERLIPELARRFALEPDGLRIQDLFVAKCALCKAV